MKVFRCSTSFVLTLLALFTVFMLGVVAYPCNAQEGEESTDDWDDWDDLIDPVTVPKYEPTFAGDSTELTATRVVATMDEPLTPGKNVIWCASFQAAWKALEDYIGEPPQFRADSILAEKLNQTADLRPFIPESAIYSKAGKCTEEALTALKFELKKRFPESNPPVLEEINPESYFTYAYLEVMMSFPISYYENQAAFYFHENSGTKTAVRSFGIFGKGLKQELSQQLQVLFYRSDPQKEYAIDLCHTSSPHQIILAMVQPGNTLVETVKSVQNKIAEQKTVYFDFSEDTLYVPDVMWEIIHHYTELVGLHFANDEMTGQYVFEALQATKFRLDRNGVELRSASWLTTLGEPQPDPLRLLFNRPFLIYMQSRETLTPYFAMWVDNAELLCKWEEKTQEK